MNRVVVDKAVSEALRFLSEPCAIFDAAGHRLGFFRPEVDPSHYETLGPSLTDEELDRRAREGAGRTLPEIMDDLGRRA